jgi:hypothetical protein
MKLPQQSGIQLSHKNTKISTSLERAGSEALGTQIQQNLLHKEN